MTASYASTPRPSSIARRTPLCWTQLGSPAGGQVLQLLNIALDGCGDSRSVTRQRCGLMSGSRWSPPGGGKTQPLTGLERADRGT